MAVVLEGTVKRFVGLARDAKPRPGVEGADGTTPTAADVPAGSRFVESDTGRVFAWNGFDWHPAQPADATAELLGELVAETRAVRSGLELFFALNHGVNIDLRTEDVSQFAGE